MLVNLKKLRLERGLSQQQLADILNVTQQAVNKYENHDTEPNLATLKQLADYFNTSVDYIIGRGDIRNSSEPVKEYILTQDEEKLFEYYRQMSRSKQRCLEEVARNLL